ncbi:MAG: hypothetical protein JKY50_09615 [Oleispira sp.]|nr:hypothetical protein [Oleispira sp.]MBL4880240.1 hypothetical protein [Oleispira sp.]
MNDLTSLINLWSDSTPVSSLVWLTIIITLLYLGRTQAHQLIFSSFRMLHTSLRLWARSISQLIGRLKQRNKEVLLAAGKAEVQTKIEREFNRISAIVQRDLSQYPALHREIKTAIETVETDYQNCAESAPLPPAWGDVVATITALPSNGDPTVNKILENIKQSIDDAHSQSLSAYQKAGSNRHKVLAKMQPDWRQLDNKMDLVKDKVDSLEERGQIIDQQMEEYQSIRSGEDKAASILATSSLTQFFIAGLVLTIAALGGLINFQLIALPMSEMVGGTSYIGSVKTSDIAALVIILIEIAMGLFLLESLRITHLFPMIGSMDDKMRHRMMIISFSILFILAGIEASLAYMRDLLAMDHEALQQSLMSTNTSGSQVTAEGSSAQFRWIPSVGQMIMGFILPFALAFIAIPLESFIHSLRTVLGLFAIAILRTLHLVLRSSASLVTQMSKVIISLYDLVIMVPLSIENVMAKRARKTTNKPTYKQTAEVDLVSESTHAD